VIGVREGWRGLVEGITEPLGRREISGLLPRGGTILGTTRTNPYKIDGGVERVLEHFAATGPRRARRGRRRGHARSRRRGCMPSTSSPSSASRRRSTTTLQATDYTFGFDTAVSIATEAIDRLHTTAESHNRVMVVEVMGRTRAGSPVMSGSPAAPT
jgi:6-phosphofructokinase 1